jgi:oxygen-independent coproporphyrinogen-3 oxidase
LIDIKVRQPILRNLDRMTNASQLARLGLFDARAPRYTSYPTANHFNSAVEAGTFANWISAVPNGAEISLYLHVPFCRRLCWFCACRTQGTTTAAPLRRYVDTLLKELSMLGDQLPGDVRLSRIHWGGGTPTLLSADLIRELAVSVAALAPRSETSEFSVEIDPNEIDDARLDALVEAGLTRASIGVQDFDPEIQKTIGRDQSYEVTKAACDGLRARGIESINLDILYGLPHQTSGRIADSVQKVLSLGPDRIALYGYAHVPWMARRQSLIPADSLPRPEERLELFETARRLFTWDGYQEIGIDHFARPNDGLAKAAREGRLNRNFQGYTDDRAEILIGLGASAISRFPQGFAQNDPATAGYTAAIDGGRFATKRGHAFTADDRIREAMITALMCDFRVDPEAVAARVHVPRREISRRLEGIVAAFPGALEPGEPCTLRPEARPAARLVARFFDAYAVKEGGHSLAI